MNKRKKRKRTSWNDEWRRIKRTSENWRKEENGSSWRIMGAFPSSWICTCPLRIIYLKWIKYGKMNMFCRQPSVTTGEFFSINKCSEWSKSNEILSIS